MDAETQSFAKAHFIGIGGAGMSGIALVLAERGCQVSGSDLKESRYVRALHRENVDIRIGHASATIDEIMPDVVVTSTAIRQDNPELVRAKELKIPVWPRAKMLSELAKGRKTIAVAGTHGKTTTSSMIASMLDKLGAEPSFLIGGIVEGFDTNGKNGSGDLYVAEADESDASFLYMNPEIAVITNIEADHLDHYGSLEEIEKTFVEFMSSVPTSGTLVVCANDPHVVELARSCKRPLVTYGTTEDADFYVQLKSSSKALSSQATVRMKDGAEVEVTLASNPGIHNQLNAAAALAVAVVLGFDAQAAAKALSAFRGVRRRFTQVGERDGVLVVDDYGHHPTEIQATLKAASELDFKRVCVVFQPHRYSRTQAFLKDFASAFTMADVVYVMDIFSAGEMPIPGVTAHRLAQKIAQNMPDKQVTYLPERAHVVPTLHQELQPGDLLITMGAGDVTLIGPAFIEAE